MSDASVLRKKAEMFEGRAESATDPISKRHYREMAAHYRKLLVEHLDVRPHEAADRDPLSAELDMAPHPNQRLFA